MLIGGLLTVGCAPGTRAPGMRRSSRPSARGIARGRPAARRPSARAVTRGRPGIGGGARRRAVGGRGAGRRIGRTPPRPDLRAGRAFQWQQTPALRESFPRALSGRGSGQPGRNSLRRLRNGDASGGLMAQQIEKVGVLGAGLMGHGIAQVAAQAGYEVVVREVDEATLAEGPRQDREAARARGREGQGHAGGRRRGARAHPGHDRTTATSPTATW